MKKINRTQLLNALEQTKLTVAKKDIVPAFMRVYFIEGKLYSSDGVSGIEVACPQLEDLTGNVGGPLFLSLIKSFTSDAVELSSSQDKVTLRCGSHRSVFPCLDVPVPYPANQRPSEWTPVPTGFVEALKRCLPFVSGDDTRANLRGAYIAGEYFYATDGHTGVRCQVEGMPDWQLLLTRESVGTIVNLGQPQAMALSGESLWLDYGDTTFFTLLMECSHYPDLDAVIEQAIEDTDLTAVPDDLVSVLERVGLFHLMGEFPKVTITSDKAHTLLASDVCELNEKIKGGLAIENPVTVNPKYLIRSLEYATEIGFSSNNRSPILAYGETVEYTAVVMPIGD